jgi:dipeptidase E
VHLNRPGFLDSTEANIEQWASRIPVPTYAIDDDTAIQVADGRIDVVSEGHWNVFNVEPRG